MCVSLPAKCQFAHGLAELRHVVRHPKYKTTKCKSYWGSGHCPYGSRCRFIHEEVEGYSPPQYSPQGSMGSMFMGEKDHMRLGSLGSVSPFADLGGVSGSAATSNNYLYGGEQLHHHHQQQPHLGVGGAMPSYPKDYSLLSPFDKSAWGTSARTTSKLTYAGDLHYPTHQQHHQQHQQQHHLQHQQSYAFGASSMGPIGGMPLASPTHHQQHAHAPFHHHRSHSSGSAGGNQSSYPDLQDAIDALMKFSLTQDNDDDDEHHHHPHHRVSASASSLSAAATAASSAVELGVTGASDADPLAASSASVKSGVGAASKSKADFALESDELWKDFPSSVQASAEQLEAPSWSASGLVLNLDAMKPFDVNEKKAAAGSGSGSGSEHSPRLSVFERFH